MASRAIRVPHSFSEADHANAVSAAAACFEDEYSCDYDDGEEQYQTVHKIESLRTKRRKEGYYADDGVTQIEPGEAEAYGEGWIADRLVRQRMLDNDPYYRFASYVSAGSNLPLGDFVNDNLVRQETQRRVAAAKQRVREQNEQRLQALATPAEIERMRQRAADARAVEESTRKSATLLEASIECYGDSKSAANAKFEQIVKFLDSDNLFNYFTASTVALRGVRGYEKTLPMTQRIMAEMTQKTITARLNSEKNAPRADRLRENMPTTANLALYEALLDLVVRDAELTAKISSATPEQLALFDDQSRYAKEPDEYARDLKTLSRLLFDVVRQPNAKENTKPNTSTSSLLLFDKITHTLYAHLNKMRRRAMLDENTYPPLRRPVNQVRRGKRSREVSLGSGTVVIDADDEDIEAIAEGEPVDAFEPEKLAEIQNTLGDNPSLESTPRLVEALLEPMASIVYDSVFYSTVVAGPLDNGLDYEAYAGGSLSDENERQRLAGRVSAGGNSVLSPFYEVWIAFAFAIVRSEWLLQAKEVRTRDHLIQEDLLDQRSFFEPLVSAVVRQELPLLDRNKREYRARVRERLIRSSRMLLCGAQALVSAFDNGSGTRILGLTDD